MKKKTSKKRNRAFLALFATGILVGFLLIALLAFSRPYKKQPDIKDSYANLAETATLLSNRQESLKREISLLQKEIASKEASLEINQQETSLLDKLRRTVGIKEISGFGIEIILDDSPQAKRDLLSIDDASLIHAADIRDLTNLLKIVGVRNIAVNDQRLSNQSSIVCVGNSILIDNTRILPPIIVQATLEDAGQYQIVEEYLKGGTLQDIKYRQQTSDLVFYWSAQNKITLPAYSGSFSTKFLEKTS